MITYSIIPKTHLERGHRLDAEYYQPEYLKVAEKVSSLPHETLEDISESIVSFGAYALTNFIEWQEGGIPFIVAENIKEGFISYEGVRYITDKTDEILKKSRVQEGQVLLSMSGSVGNAAVAYKIPSRLNSNQDIVKIRLKKNYSPYFLATFLNSKYGRMQVLRLPVGSVQQHIFLWQMKSLLVPILLASITDRVEKIYRGGLEQLEISEFLYSQAENLLLAELGLKDFKPQEELSYIVNLSEVKSTHRADAEYFQPKYEKLIEKIKKQNIEMKNLGEITNFLNHAQQPPYIEGGDVPIITQKHLGQSFINLGALNDLGTKYTSNDWINKYSVYKLKQGDVLYYSVGAYIGKTNIFLEDLNATAASFITIIRAKEELDPTYLMVVFNSVVGKLQSDKWQSATAQQYIYPKDIKNFKIPILSKPIQQKIADLVRQSHQARKKAKELLEKAKREVEEFIEKKQ